jgi:hypothetical protein
MEAQWVVLVVEAAVGVWLISNVAPRGAWVAGLSLFFIFAVASLVLGLIGRSSCGCLGRLISINPWAILVFDLMAVLLLLFARPQTGVWFGPVGSIVLGTAGVVALVYLGLTLTGGVRHSLARVAGVSLIVEPPVVTLEPGRAEDSQEFSVSLTNLTDRPIRVFGGTRNGLIVVTDGLPLEIPPGASVGLPIRVTLKGTPGLIEQTYKLYTDAPGGGVVVGRLRGRLIE